MMFYSSKYIVDSIANELCSNDNMHTVKGNKHIKVVSIDMY